MFKDTSNLELMLNTTTWAKTMLQMMADRTNQSVTLKRVYVKDDTVVVAFIIGNKKAKRYSVELPIATMGYDAELIVRSADNSTIAQKTKYDDFIYWKGLN